MRWRRYEQSCEFWKASKCSCAFLLERADRYGNKPLYQALVELFRREKLAGATVLRGTLGFGAKSHLHTTQCSGSVRICRSVLSGRHARED